MLSPSVPEVAEDRARQDRSSLLSAFFIGAILLSPFQNSMLQLTPLRFLGASLAFLPMVLICVFSPIRRLFQGRWGKAETGIFVFFVYSTVISTLGVLGTDAGNTPMEFLFRKLLTNSTLNFLLIYPVFAMPLPGKAYRLALLIAFTVAISGFFLVDLLNLPHLAPPSFFKVKWGPTSPSGFSSEQSTFAATVATLGLTAAALSVGRSGRFFYMLLVLVFVTVVSHSKGTIICLVLGLGLAYLLSRGKPLIIKMIEVCLVVALAGGVYGVLMDKFKADIHHSSSSSTRSILILTSIPSLFEHPIGVGYANYIPTIISYARPTAQWVRENILPNARTSEIERYIASQDKEALNIKAQFFEYAMVFGWPGVAVIVWFHWKLYKRVAALPDKRRTSFMILFWFLVASMMTYMPALGMYFYTIAYAVLVKSDLICAVAETVPKRKPVVALKPAVAA